MFVSVVAAARPNFMKVAPVIAELAAAGATPELVHTGQHYDDAMSKAFFDDLDLPRPDVNLGAGSGTQAEQTARVLVAFEHHLKQRRPDLVVVVGDVNSTLAAALAAAKLTIPVAHVEAGLRSRDWTMPEEINRVLTDRLSQWLLTPSEDADANLLAEGIDPDRIHLVGNVMIDTLLRLLPKARRRTARLLSRFEVEADRYGVLTLHRPANVDQTTALATSLTAVGKVSAQIPIIFPVHPRTRIQIEASKLEVPTGLRTIDPLGYLDFLALMDAARLVLTDSGGIQEETSVLGVPCLTLRKNTERPITCRLGTNQVVGTTPETVAAAAEVALRTSRAPATLPLWDGHAARRAVKALLAG